MDRSNILRIWLIISQSDPQENSTYLKTFLSEFERRHAIKIQEEYVTWDRVLTALIKAFKNDNAPDVIMVGTSWMRTLVHMGYLSQVPDWVDFEPAINQGINKVCKYDGKYFAVPWITETVIMAGRKDYMSKLNINRKDLEDWQGLKETVKRITEMRKKDKDVPKPLSLAIKRENDTIQRFFSFLWSHGWSFPDLSEIPEKLVYDPFVIDMIKNFATLKIINENPEEMKVHPYEVNEEFYDYGKSVFYIGSWYAIVDRINNADWGDENKKAAANYSVLPFPDSGGGSVTYGGGTVLAVPACSGKKEKAWRLVEYLINDKLIRKIDIGNVPAFEDEFWQKKNEDNRVKLMYEQTINSNIYPIHPAWISIEKQIINGVASILLSLVKNERNDLDEKELSLLEKTDQKIKKIINMSWEVK
ncbi:MAG: extracellular solute-binding protein [Halanaerobiaceae bacterium]